MPIEIRSAATEDAPSLLEIYSYYVKETAITFELDVPTLKDFSNRIENTLQNYPYLVLLENKKIVGYAYAGPLNIREAYRFSCECSIYLDRNSTHKGYGKLLYQKLEETLQKKGILNLYACIAYTNKEDTFLTNNSTQFHAHLGYKTIGHFHQCGYKFNTWYDMIWMEKIIGNHN